MEVYRRIDTLDYLRGFALLGIILVNVIPLLGVTQPAPNSTDAAYLRFLYLFVEGRFYTIFTFLFGVGFYMFITRANEKGKNGFILFLRRILVMFLIGLVHVKFHPGEALTVYAVCGAILLPFYKANRVVNLVFGILMLVVFSLFSYKLIMVVPLMLLGICAGQFRLFERMSQHVRKVAIFTGIMFVLSVIGLIYQYQYAPFVFGQASETANIIDSQRFLSIGITIGPFISACYVGLLLMLLQFPMARKVLAPLKYYGRMALTNYLSQTVFILLAGRLFNLYNDITYIQSLYLCLFILFIQLLFSLIWLRYFKFGPVEWIWRMLTYFKKLPIM